MLYKILLCRLCKSGVAGGSKLNTHFREHRVKGEVLEQINDYYGAEDLHDPTHYLPESNELPIVGLPQVAGFKCRSCWFLTASRDVARKHGKAAHPDTDGEKFTDVTLQTWRRGRYARYWVVDARDDPTPITTTEDADASSDQQLPQTALDRKLAALQTQLQEREEERIREGDREESILRDSAWVKRVRWTHHFGSRDKLLICHAAVWDRSSHKRIANQSIEEARAELVALVRATESFQRNVVTCSLRLDNVPVSTKLWLSSISPTRPSSQVFSVKATKQTQEWYSLIGQRYIAYCLRAHQLGREQAFEKLAISFTDEQWGLLSDVAHEADNCIGGHPASDDSGYNSSQTPASDEGSGDEDGDGDIHMEHVEVEGPDNEGGATADLDRAVFLFMIASIKQKLGGNEYKNPLLCFCAALGISEVPLGFRESIGYTKNLAALLWLIRVFFVEHVFRDGPDEIDDIEATTLDRFQEMHEMWLCEKSASTASTIISWMSYGKGIRDRTTGQSCISWSGDRQTVSHEGEDIRLGDFKQVARKLIDAAEDQINKVMGRCWAKISHEIDIGRIFDTMIRHGSGLSFATHEKNRWLQPGFRKVIDLLGSSVWNSVKGGVETKSCSSLAQATEQAPGTSHGADPYMGWTARPGAGGDDNASLRLMGMVMIVTDRDKMQEKRGVGRRVARFLPDRIGKIVIAYITWLLSTEHMLRTDCSLAPTPNENFEFMWRNGDSKLWDTSKLSGILGRVTMAGTGVRLTVDRYRHIVIELGREIQGIIIHKLDITLGNDEESEGEVDPMTGEKMAYRGGRNNVWDLQGTHSSALARLHYGLNTNFPGMLQPGIVESFREISRLWHGFLVGHDIAAQGPQVGTRTKRRRSEANVEPRGSQEPPSTRRRIQSTSVPRSADGIEKEMAAGLRALVGPDATWRLPEQEESMRHIMQMKGDDAFISVLPTGAGKSILFMLPSLLAVEGVTIVVVPFAPLIANLVYRAREAGIDCVRFTARSPADDECCRAARLVFVSANVAGQPDFMSWADGLCSSGTLGRIFVDECHTTITEVSYRPRLEKIRGLRRFRRPIVLLTATLPAKLESWLRRQMIMENADIIRARTTKLNCRYRVQAVAHGDKAMVQATVRAVEELSRGMSGQQKGVVYCQSKRMCLALAEAIGCGSHHSGMSEKDQDEARSRWAEMRQDSRWIVATSGLGAGVEYGGIIAIVHAGWAYGLVDFIQQTGRGGRRAGEVVESVILDNGRPPRTEPTQDFAQQINAAHMAEFVQTTGCRRSVLSEFNDGVSGDACGS